MLGTDKAQYLKFNKFDEDIKTIKEKLKKLKEQQIVIGKKNKKQTKDMIQKIYELRDVCEQTGQICKIKKDTHEIDIIPNLYYKKPAQLISKEDEELGWVKELKDKDLWGSI